MRDPAAALIAGLKRAPGMLVSVTYTAPGAQPLTVKAERNVSVESETVGRSKVNSVVRFVRVHSSDIGAGSPGGTMRLDGVDYRVQVAAEMDRDGWWTLGLTVPRLGG